MAAVTAAAIAGGSAIYQTAQGVSQTNKANDALNAFDRQELENVYENIGISTVGSDLIKDENALVAGNAIDAARSGGIRGIMSTLPKIQAQNNAMNREARNYLDQQVQRRDYAIAGDEARIRQMQEQRDNADLAGIGQQLAVGQQNTWSGIRGIANAGMSALSNADFGGATPQVQATNIQSMGATPLSLPNPMSEISAPLMPNNTGF